MKELINKKEPATSMAGFCKSQNRGNLKKSGTVYYSQYEHPGVKGDCCQHYSSDYSDT